jgi:hypothetical protein
VEKFMQNKRTALLVGAALLLTSCGSSGESDKAEATTAASDQQAFIDCLSDNGVEVPATGSTELPDLNNIDPDAIQKATEACASLAPSGLPTGGPAGGPDATALQAFVDCMNDRGVKVEPNLDSITALDEKSKKVRKALEKCQPLIAP